MLNGCPVALQQVCLTDVEIFADLEGKCASDSPPATIPPAILVSPYRPDIVEYNAGLRTISLLELSCLFDSNTDHSAAHQRKESKLEYQQIVAEFDHLGFVIKYFTIEIGCFGHYHKETIKLLKIISYQTYSNSRASLDKAAVVAMTTSWPEDFLVLQQSYTWTN